MSGRLITLHCTRLCLESQPIYICYRTSVCPYPSTDQLTTLPLTRQVVVGMNTTGPRHNGLTWMWFNRWMAVEAMTGFPATITKSAIGCTLANPFSSLLLYKQLLQSYSTIYYIQLSLLTYQTSRPRKTILHNFEIQFFELLYLILIN